MSTARTWQDNAAEFALLDKGEGWPFARLIACSVRKGSGTGGAHHRNDRYGGGKVSAQEFARQAETSAPRVLRYLEAWERAAEQGLCTPSADLNPSDAPTVMEPDIPWGRVYDASKAGGRPRDSKPSDAVAIIGTAPGPVVEAMTPSQRLAMADALRGRERADRKVVHDRIVADELAHGVSHPEGAALDDHHEALQKLVDPVWKARHALGFVIGDWEEYKGRLQDADRTSIRNAVTDIQDYLGVLTMHLTDDVVGEVLRHENRA